MGKNTIKRNYAFVLFVLLTTVILFLNLRLNLIPKNFSDLLIEDVTIYDSIGEPNRITINDFQYECIKEILLNNKMQPYLLTRAHGTSDSIRIIVSFRNNGCIDMRVYTFALNKYNNFVEGGLMMKWEITEGEALYQKLLYALL
jgi:hypothetical protein